MQVSLLSDSESFVRRCVKKLDELGVKWSNFYNQDEIDKNSAILLIDGQLLNEIKDEIGQLKSDYQERVLLLSIMPSLQEGLLLLKSGVRGYANTHISPLHLQGAIQTLMAGGTWYDPFFTHELIASIEPAKYETKNLSDILSTREEEVARYVASGMSNKDIAQTLNTSERTIKAHLQACYKKLQLHDRVSLALLVKRSNHE